MATIALQQPDSAKPESSTQCLPDELYSRIFQFCLPSSEFPQPRALEAPLVFGLVNKRWRSVALSTPDLWTSIALFWIRPYKVPGLLSWFSRAGVKPISFSIVMTDSDYTEGGAQVLQCLVSLSHRWYRVHLKFGGVYMRDWINLLSPIQGNLPLLESLRIYIPRGVSAPFFTSAPRLSSVGTRRHYTMRWNLPWNQLTCLDVDLSRRSLIRVLMLCVNLESLKLRIDDLEPEFPDHDRNENVQVLSNITRLCVDLHLASSHDPARLLDHLEGIMFPKLDTIILRGHHHQDPIRRTRWDDTWVQVHCPPFSQLSPQQLKQLAICGLSVHVGTLATLLQSLPSVDELVLDRVGTDIQELFGRLSLRAGSRSSFVLVPYLRQLRVLGIPGRIYLNRKVISDMISSRISAADDFLEIVTARLRDTQSRADDYAWRRSLSVQSNEVDWYDSEVDDDLLSSVEPERHW
jgi:hypothetical protein